MESVFLRWLVGLLGVSVVLGALLSYQWYSILCWLLGVEQTTPLIPKIPIEHTGPLTGIVERIFFTVIIATSMSGTAIAMVVWITIKELILWKEITKDGPSPRATISLLTSVGSMLIAIVGAEICKGTLFN